MVNYCRVDLFWGAVVGRQFRKSYEDDLEAPDFARQFIIADVEWSQDNYVRTTDKARQRNESAWTGKEECSVSVLLAAIERWIFQRDELHMKELPRLSVEVYTCGEVAVRDFFQAWEIAHTTKDSHIDEVTYRKKICVVGPSSWGKTSFIKSFTTREATLEEADERTMGIDLFSWSFEGSSSASQPKKFEVAIWDFADLKAYADALETARNEGDDCDSVSLARFVEWTICRWIRMICACEPESEFIFLGTKSDLIGHDAAKIKEIEEDLMARINRSEELAVNNIKSAIDELRTSNRRSMVNNADIPWYHQQARKLDNLLVKRRFLSHELKCFSSADLSDMENIRTWLEDLIVRSETSFSMPEDYCRVASAIQKMSVQSPLTTQTPGMDANHTFQNVHEVCWRITQDASMGYIRIGQVMSILQVLHSLGDILWFDKSPDESLASTVFLSPKALIHFVKQVINHKFGDELQTEAQTRLYGSDLIRAVQTEGRVTHDLLCQLDYWKDIAHEPAIVLQLKELLFLFKLAYPASDGGKMTPESDLIVPMYWKKSNESTANGEGILTKASAREKGLTKHVRWEYEFQDFITDAVYEQLGVQSYSNSHSSKRSLTQFSFSSSVGDVSHSRIWKQYTSDSMSICVDVFASTWEAAWGQVIWYSSNLERLLDEYPGLWVDRYAISARERRLKLDRLVGERLKDGQMRASVGAASVANTTSSQYRMV